MFIRERTSKTKNCGITHSFQMLECYRDGSRIRQRVLCSLGSSRDPQEALSNFRKRLEWRQRWLENTRNQRVRGEKACRAKERHIEQAQKRVDELVSKIRAVECVVSKILACTNILDTTTSMKVVMSTLFQQQDNLDTARGAEDVVSESCLREHVCDTTTGDGGAKSKKIGM